MGSSKLPNVLIRPEGDPPGQWPRGKLVNASQARASPLSPPGSLVDALLVAEHLTAVQGPTKDSMGGGSANTDLAGLPASQDVYVWQAVKAVDKSTQVRKEIIRLIGTYIRTLLTLYRLCLGSVLALYSLPLALYWLPIHLYFLLPACQPHSLSLSLSLSLFPLRLRRRPDTAGRITINNAASQLYPKLQVHITINKTTSQPYLKLQVTSQSTADLHRVSTLSETSITSQSIDLSLASLQLRL
jgi:hypothetical protein